jgi:Asp-tRNA(Asn)/Glu-tRNA(Gln) amidotransferase A subunit family amidase
MVEAGSLSENIPGTSIDAATATAGQLRQAIASGALTSADLTAFYLARIERLNPGLRAVITVSESAAADARASDNARVGASPLRLGPSGWEVGVTGRS